MTTNRLIALSLVAVASSACSSGGDRATADTSAAPATTPATTPAVAHDMGSMEGMADMTGDPDRDFLRMMSDHHKGMLLMTDAAKSGGATVTDEAQRMSKAQSAEMEKMKSILKARYSDGYAPKVMTDAKTMAGELGPLTGSAFDRKFLQHTIHHHQAAVKMIDAYLPRSKEGEVKAMAVEMKTAQQKEIREFEGKLAAL